ncbi:MAG: SH3 domain-containing protein [Desertifilum sp.]|nr:SH3 domain-containing protein [Desertifilum sp.]
MSKISLVSGMSLTAFLLASGAPSMAQDAAARLTANSGAQVNIRSGPGTNFSLLHYGYAGDSVRILETNRGQNGTWHRVQFTQSGARGWVRSDFLLQGSADVSTSCHAEITKVRDRFNNMPNAFLRSLSIERDSLAPGNRPMAIAFSIGGRGQDDILSSGRMLLSLSQGLIRECGNTSAVRFHSDSSGWHEVYGLVNGTVRGFTCRGDDGQRLRWGEFNCGI